MESGNAGSLTRRALVRLPEKQRDRIHSTIYAPHFMISTTHFNGAYTVTKNPKLPNLEASLTEINSLIDQMEKGDLSLEQSLTQFERGITLIKHAQKILQTAEQKVQLLMKNNGDEKLMPYENNEE